MFLARKTVKTSGLPKNSVVYILVVRFSSHVIHGICNTLQSTTFENPTRTASFLTEIHQLQFFSKKSHLDTGPTLNCHYYYLIDSILAVEGVDACNHATCGCAHRWSEHMLNGLPRVDSDSTLFLGELY